MHKTTPFFFFFKLSETTLFCLKNKKENIWNDVVLLDISVGSVISLVSDFHSEVHTAPASKLGFPSVCWRRLHRSASALRLSMGRVFAQLGTDSTESGFEKTHPPPTARVNRSGISEFNEWQTGRSTSEIWENDERTTRKGEKNPDLAKISSKSTRFARSGGNLTRFNEISLDSVKISSNLREIALESGFFCRDLGFLSPKFGFLSPESGFLARIWVFCRIMGFSPIGSGFSGFWVRETETNPSESVSDGENPLPTAGVGRVSWFQISSGWVSEWVGSLDMFGQPYCWVYYIII